MDSERIFKDTAKTFLTAKTATPALWRAVSGRTLSVLQEIGVLLTLIAEQ